MHPDRFDLLARLANGSADITNLSDQDEHCLSWLISKQYVSVPLHGRNIYRVSDAGHIAISDEQYRRRIDRRKSRIDWIRYIITTAIALAALLKSYWPEISAAAARLSTLLTR